MIATLTTLLLLWLTASVGFATLIVTLLWLYAMWVRWTVEPPPTLPTEAQRQFALKQIHPDYRTYKPKKGAA